MYYLERSDIFVFVTDLVGVRTGRIGGIRQVSSSHSHLQ